MISTEYVFDWRAEAVADGWSLHEGIWHHLLGAERSDQGWVYLGSQVWAETWPWAPAPDRRVDRDSAW